LSTKGQRKIEREEKRGRKDARSHLEYATRVIPHDVYARRSRRSLPPGNNVARCQRECKRGSALAYCLKLLIGLRSDTVFPRYALFSLSFSFSFSLYLSRESSVYFPSQLPYSPVCSALTLSMPIVDDARPSSPIEETKKVRPVVAEGPIEISTVHSVTNSNFF